MKKIDLHMHTVPTISDGHFDFSLEKLKEYVKSAELDAIAITNHDFFDLEQFRKIDSELDCVIFPGIEINLTTGHLLLISENQNLEEFKIKTQGVTDKIKNTGDSISVDELITIFGDLNKYLLIPHYEKKPAISRSTLSKIIKYISAGEVDSPKKFIRLAKDNKEITPVIFSDVRIREGIKKFPTKHTYVDCGKITLKSLKHSLRDKNKVALSRTEGNSLFQIFDDGQKLSTGLNIILGARSSGKTETLTQINKDCENVKYIPQFSLVQRDDANYEKEFNEDIARKKSVFADKHLTPFKKVLDEILNIDIRINERKTDEYLSTLLKSADEAEKRDAFSKSALFNETNFEVTKDNGLSELIGAVRKLIDNIEYRGIIDKHIEVSHLKSLAIELIELLWDKAYERKKKVWVNDIVKDVKGKLHLRTSATQVKDIDLYTVMMENEKVSKFNQIAKLLQTEKIIFQENIQEFKVICKQRAFNGAGEILRVSGQRAGFSDAYKEYDFPYKYLIALKENGAWTPSEFYKYFACIEYEILNKDGFKVSGGERSEFRLLQEIKDAQNFDYLLIDEPESSFDNIFLKSEANQMLKQIAKTMPVVVVTHNSTVGASINADYVVYTSKEIEGNNIIYRRYSGHPSDTDLRSTDGKSISNFHVTMNALEAGEDAYLDRREGYENIKN
ncbi:phosphotransferase [Saccharospirillum sp. MSK14-1]|uniref:phosphotransferase n=1 Tax=Saccharospirillum sp. MSK14-1 TaxID=1897632 RepID=UPI000D3CDFD4|nr:phosphotransferase [Saccharospirillum sp. MSK14-1]PTY38428.1 phosphotransferase [Saccharospirillum sp. MSK14-1]